MTVGKILVPLDGSALAEAALSKAVVLAKEADGAGIVLVRATEASTLAGRDPIEAQVAVVKEAEEYLEGVAARVRAEGVKDVTASVWYGPPAPAIVEAADMTRADLVVMSTHGRSGLGRLLLGSVAESVLRATHIPILLLRPAGVAAEPTTSDRAEKEAVHV
ncbi:MAG: universal stress protein [Candidatus Rokubacteria bacterium]|nr:universal stress protein [Candidatus Rokubacteria bacterium]